MPSISHSIRRMISLAKKSSLPLLDALTAYDGTLEERTLNYQTPQYIYDNMKHRFRYYQDRALHYFHFALNNTEFKFMQSNHVLFNMATGSGKTDLMAGLILYLFKEEGYQRFLFTVNTNSVLQKTIDNLTDTNSIKNLYNHPIEIEGNRIRIEQVRQFPTTMRENVIYIKLDTIQGIASDLFTEKENTMGLTEYKKHKTVILADEAHHYSASTKKEKEDERSWERTIDLILGANNENRLLEFTATIDLENKQVYQKYKDKIIYRYALDRYILDGYSKNIRRIQSSNKDIENMMNVILLSEFRRLYAKEMHGAEIKPVILFKSPKIKDSNEAESKFLDLIEDLTPDMIESFIRLRFDENSEEQSETLYRTYRYYLSNVDKLPEMVREMKRQFSKGRIINANDTDRGNMLEKGQYEALNTLENPSNLYRVVFAVAKLTEGWDVLNLYDIVRISDTENAKGTKTSTMAEAQLIGRGARYNPFRLDDKISYQRRFEEDGADSLLLETLHYHTINEPQYLKNLVESLNEMNLPSGEDKKNPLIEVKVKSSFKKTDIWKKGSIYYNERVLVADDHYDNLSKYGVDNRSDIIINWHFTTREYNYDSAMVQEDFSDTFQKAIQLDLRLIMKAMNRNSFYHFARLKEYLPLLKSREEFLGESWLNLNNRTLYAVVPRSMGRKKLKPEEKLEIFEIYLRKVEQQIKQGYRKEIGTNKFIGYPIREYVSDYRKRQPNYDTGRMKLFDIRASQNVSRQDYKNEDFFVYDSAFINQTEQQLIDRIKDRLIELNEKYSDVYLVRMDENMHRESAKSEKLKLYQFDRETTDVHFEAFQPDFILLLANADHYLQIFIEPKGINLLEREAWKEDLLMYINNHEADLVFEEEVNGLKIKGLKFYTINDSRGTIEQLGEIALGEKFTGLSL